MVKILDDLDRARTSASRAAEIRPKETRMHTLAVGAPAPDLALEALTGHTLRLSDLRGRKVLLAFLRNAGCAVCNLWVARTDARAARWRESGLEVVAVFESSADKLRAQFEGRTPALHVLADPDGVAHDAYGSRTDPERVAAVIASGSAEEALRRAESAGFPVRREEGANFFRLPAEVLVREDGTIALAHVAEEIADHLDAALVDRFARGEAL
jgi:peroxiredoxin Q/BCP